MLSRLKIRSAAGLHMLALLLLAAIVTFHVPLAQTLTDPFQESEYAMFGFLAQTTANFRMPILIHGGIDTVPSTIATLACSPDTQIFCVRTINTLIQFAASCLFLVTLAVLVGLGTRATVLASLPAVAMLWLYDGPTTFIVDAQQGTPSVRDLFVMAALLIMALACRRLEAGPSRGEPYALFALGVLAGTGSFWVYNRGLALILLVVAFVAALCLLRRSFGALLPAIAGALAGFVVVVGFGKLQVFTDTLFNIRYWSQNNAIWHRPFAEELAPPAVALSVLILAGVIPLAGAFLQSKQPGRVLMLTMLGLAFALYAAQSFNRPDLLHLRWVIWPATLMLAIIIRDQAGSLTDRPICLQRATPVAFALLSTLCIEFYSDNSIGRVVFPGLVENVRTLTRPAPTDRALAGPDLARISDLVKASGSCTFAANNLGIIHLLSHMPPCSRFVFGTYIAPDHQQDAIADLETNQPEIVLWDSTSWEAHIDGRSFRDRTPVVADWIEAHYPVRTNVGPYVLLSRAPLNP